jgi:hypothetical protein
MIFCPSATLLAQKKDAGKGEMTIRILTEGFRSRKCTLSLRIGGKLFDLDGHPVQINGLREFLSDPDLLNESKELVINLHVGDRTVSLDQLAKALGTIQDSIPKENNTIVFVNLPIRKP